MGVLEKKRFFFAFNVKAQVDIDLDKKTCIWSHTPQNPLFYASHARLTTQGRASKPKTDSFVSWLHGDVRQLMPFLQHFSVHLGLIQVIEKYLQPQAEIDATLWYVREILASWHRLVGYCLQLNRGFPHFQQDCSLDSMLDKMLMVSLNGLFGGIIDSSSIPLGLLPGSLLFSLADDWHYKQADSLQLMDELIIFFQEKVDRLIKRKYFLRASLLVEDDWLLSIPLLHPLHYLFASRVSALRRRFLTERYTEEVLPPSTVSHFDAWHPPPLLKNSRGRWSDYIYVILHLMRWEMNRIRTLLSKVDTLDVTSWKLNWSTLQFPNTRAIHPCWSSEGEVLLQVGLLPNRYFQFVRPLLPHYHVLHFLIKAALQTTVSNLRLPVLLMKAFLPGSELQITFHGRSGSWTTEFSGDMINENAWGS